MLTALKNAPLLVWALSWGVLFSSLVVGGVFNSPISRQAYVAVAVAGAAWTAAGLAAPVRARQDATRLTLIAWLSAFAVAVIVSAVGMPLLDSVPGFAGFHAMVAAGGLAGTIANTLLVAFSGLREPLGQRIRRALLVGLVIPGAFCVATYIAVATGYVFGQLARNAIIDLVGWFPGLLLGWFVGGALGGLVAGIATRNVQGYAHAP